MFCRNDACCCYSRTGDKSSISCNDIFVEENENKNGNYLQNENYSGYGHNVELRVNFFLFAILHHGP